MTIPQIANVVMYLSLILSFLIAFIMGKERKIGIYWSLFFCITFSFIIGFVIVLFSRKINKRDIVNSYNNPKWYAIIFAVLLALIGLFFLIQFWILIENEITAKENILFTYKTDYGTMYRYFALAIGYCGAALFIIKDRRIVQNPNNVQAIAVAQKFQETQKTIIPKRQKMAVNHKSLFKKIGYTILIIIAILIITNPSAKRFKEYRGENSYEGLKRQQNWIIFSIYKDGYDSYLGIVLNFFELEN